VGEDEAGEWALKLKWGMQSGAAAAPLYSSSSCSRSSGIFVREVRTVSTSRYRGTTFLMRLLAVLIDKRFVTQDARILLPSPSSASAV